MQLAVSAMKQPGGDNIVSRATICRRRVLIALSLAAAAPGSAVAQAFPTRPITIILPFAVGGPSDVLARALQAPLQKALGQPIVIDTKVGGSGIVGTRHVVRSPADGYTLLQQTNGILITPYVNKSSGFDPMQDLLPIAFLAVQPMVLVSHPSLPVHSVKELIAYARANPAKINFASSGPASNGRLATERFMRQADIHMTHIAYKGVGQITQALVSGEVQVMLSSTTPQINEFVRAGRLNLLGIASLEPSPLAPGAEPIARTLPGFQADVQHLLFAPRGTPRGVVAKINEAIAAAVAQPEIKAVFAASGASANVLSPDALKTRLDQDYKAWGEFIPRLGITEE
jgi:tripartite-type tricarboxylate transporter receptor subunit TctC